MSQYQKEQISVHSNAVTYLFMTALITLCRAFVLSFSVCPVGLMLGLSHQLEIVQFTTCDNGFSCYVITLVTTGIFNPAIVYDHLGEIYSLLVVGSFLVCCVLYVKGHLAPSSSDWGSSGNLLVDFYWGMELYPRVGANFNIKVFTNCRFGMMRWAVLIVSYAVKQVFCNL